MSNKKRYGLFLAVVFIVTSLTQIAMAAIPAVPERCEDSRAKRAYDLGFLKGGNIVAQAWNAIDNDCLEIINSDTFENAIIHALEVIPVPNTTDFVVCHYYGFVAGANAALQDIEEICPVELCIQEGESIGEMAAIMFCELSIAFDGLAEDEDLIEGTLTVCDEHRVEGCQSKFSDVTETYTNDDGACADYGQNSGDTELVEVWEQAQDNQCVMNPVEPDTDSDGGVDTDTDTNTI